MIFLLNRERVINEVMEWFQLHACNALQIPLEKFTVELSVDERGNMTPNVEVAREDIEGVSDEQFSELMAGLYRVAVGMFHDRNEGLKECRRSTSKTASAEPSPTTS